MNLIATLNQRKLGRSLENTLLKYHFFRLKCPHCEKVGTVFSPSTPKKLFKIVGTIGNKHIETINFNGYCKGCNGTFRMSNGATIKRAKNWIEINKDFQELISLFFVAVGVIGTITMMELKNLIGAMSFLFLSMILHIYLSYFYTNIELSDMSSDATADFPAIQDLEELKFQNQALQIEQQKLISAAFQREYQIQQFVAKQQQEVILKQNQLILGDKTDKIFNSERELQNYLHKNIEKLKFNGRSLRLYPNGYEFKAGEAGEIDLLCIDDLGNFCVIETKVDKMPDKVIGQISRYMGWVDTHLNKNKRKVYGLVVGLNHDIKLKYAAKPHDNIFIFEYKLGFNRID